MTRETHARADPTKSQEEVRKYTTRVERCNQETEKVQNTCTHSPMCSSSNTSLGVSLSPEKHTCVCFKTRLGLPLLFSTLHKTQLQVLKREMINQKQENPEKNRVHRDVSDNQILQYHDSLLKKHSFFRPDTTIRAEITILLITIDLSVFVGTRGDHKAFQLMSNIFIFTDHKPDSRVMLVFSALRLELITSCCSFFTIKVFC